MTRAGALLVPAWSRRYFVGILCSCPLKTSTRARVKRRRHRKGANSPTPHSKQHSPALPRLYTCTSTVRYQIQRLIRPDLSKVRRHETLAVESLLHTGLYSKVILRENIIGGIWKHDQCTILPPGRAGSVIYARYRPGTT